MTSEISFILAFCAGLLSFLSPCVLPLIPSWLCLIGGISSSQIDAFSEEHGSVRIKGLVSATLLFVLGFTTVFIVMSLLLSRTFLLLSAKQIIINRVAGVFIVLMGLHILFDLFKFLNYEKRPQVHTRTLAGCFVTGAAFATGWTPCIGPILSSILFLAAQEGKTAHAVIYLAFYSLGLGLPFVMASLFLQRFLKHLAALRRMMKAVQKVSGTFLVLLGIWVISGSFRSFSAGIVRYTGGIINIMSNNSFARLIPASLYLLFAIIPILYMRTKKRLLPVALSLCIGASFLFLLQITGIINTALMIESLLIFTQNF